MNRISTTTYFLELTLFVINRLNKYFQIDVIYTDFSKSFESQKLDLLGFPVDLLRLI